MKKTTVNNSSISEIGVFLLTENERFKNLECSEFNIPHVSLFQLAIRNSSLNCFIKDFEEFFVKKASKIFLRPFKVEKFHGNTILRFKIENKFYKNIFFHTKKNAIKTCLKYASNNFYLAQIDFQKLSSEEYALVRKYGIYWGVSHKDFYKTYMTLKYQKYDMSLYSILENREPVCFSRLGIGLLGHHGNVKKVIKYIALEEL